MIRGVKNMNIHIGSNHWIPIKNIVAIFHAIDSEPIKNFRNRHKRSGTYINVTKGSKCYSYIMVKAKNGFILYGSPLYSPRLVSYIKNKEKEELIHYKERLPIVEVSPRIYITITEHYLISSSVTMQIRNMIQHCESENNFLKFTANRSADINLFLFHDNEQLAVSLTGFPKRAIKKIDRLSQVIKEEWENDINQLKKDDSDESVD